MCTLDLAAADYHVTQMQRFPPTAPNRPQADRQTVLSGIAKGRTIDPSFRKDYLTPERRQFAAHLAASRCLLDVVSVSIKGAVGSLLPPFAS